MPLTAFAKEHIPKVIAAILEEPKRFDMRDWYKYPGEAASGVPSCGTIACFAGWVIALTLPKPSDLYVTCIRLSDSVSEQSSTLLGISYKQAQRLYYECYWPKQFNEPPVWRPFMQPGTQEYADRAAARFQFFLDTDGTDNIPEDAPFPVRETFTGTLLTVRPWLCESP